MCKWAAQVNAYQQQRSTDVDKLIEKKRKLKQQLRFIEQMSPILLDLALACVLWLWQMVMIYKQHFNQDNRQK